MPHFEPAYENTPNWRDARSTPTAAVIRFHDEADREELIHFINILIQLSDAKSPKQGEGTPIIYTLSGNEIRLPLLLLLLKHRRRVSVSFFFAGNIMHKLLSRYCHDALMRHRDRRICEGFISVLHRFKIPHQAIYLPQNRA